MPSTINNDATTTYQFDGSGETLVATTNENTITLEDASGLTVTKTANPTTFAPGDIIAYTVTITNNSGSFLNGVRVIDDLGGGNLAYVTGSGSLTSTTTYPVNPIQTNPLTFTLQELNVGQTMTLNYRAQVIFNLPASVTSINNSLRAIGYTSTGTINGFSSATINRNNSISLTSTKTSSLSEVSPRQPFSYYITLRNNNNVNATANSITDQLPTNFVLTSVEAKVGMGQNRRLTPSEYTLSASNLLTVPSVSGTSLSVPANGTSVLTINGYFV